MQVMVGNNYGSYSFNASAGTITLSGLPSAFALGQLKLVINALTNTIIFNLADPSQTATISGNVITLSYNTTAMNNSDPLQIFLEVPGEEVLQGQTTLAPIMLAMAGLTNDVTPQYKGVPLTAAGASVKVDGSAVTQPVSGTFWQATQPVSGSVSISNFPSTQAVTGTFWQATQPVSGSVSISNFPPTQAVTGTFWQSTQPVSGTVGISGTVPVSGTFWQATQPVSGSVSISNFPSTQPVTGTFWQATQPVSGSVSVSNFPGTQAVSLATLPALTTGSAVIGSVKVTDGTNFQPTGDSSARSIHTTIDNASIAVTGSVSVSNLPSTQTVAGSVSVSNFPATQPVSGTVGVSGTVPVSGTFWQTTQPVSSTQLPAALDGSGNLKTAIQGTVPVSGTFWQSTQPVSGSVSVSNFPSSQAVTGTFWQSTQPVSGTVGISGTVPVSGTFWQATQPVSGSVSVSNFPATQAVTGTFWQTTQPVSGTVGISGTVPVSGTFWQATQPVSGSVSISNFPATQAVTGTFWQTTQPVSFSGQTVAATQSGTWIATTNADAPIAGGASPTKSVVAGGTYNNPKLTLTTGQSAGLSLGSDGSLLVQLADPLPAGTNIIGNAVLSSAAGTEVGVFAGGRLNVATEPTQLFVDTFDGTLDTTNNWMVPTASGGGVVASATAGTLTLGSGNTTGGYSYLQSNPNFPPSVPSYLTAQFVVEIEYPVISQTYRFWGFGTSTATPTTTAPLMNAVGFELYTDGKLYAVVYAAGTRTVIQDLSSSTGNNTQPADANFHRYSLAWRSDKQFFMIDSVEACATGNFTFPQVQTLPLKLQAIAGTSPASSGVLTVTSVGVGDTGANNFTLSDATYGWRGATVDASGNLHVLAATADGTVLDTQTSITSTGPGITYTVGGYGYISLQFGGVWSGTIRVESSNDGVNWIQQYVQYLGSGYTTDVINLPTIVQVSASSLYMRYYVVQLSGTATAKVVGNTGTIPTSSLLGMSFDANSGVQLQANVNLNKDVNTSLILSDAPAPIILGGGAGANLIVDTQGYQTLNITTQALAANVTTSNDKVTWSALTGTPLVLGTLVTAVSANAGYTFPCLARFIRFTLTATGNATVYLRNTPWQGAYTTSVPSSTASNNVAQFAGTAVVSGGVAGTLAVGGNIAVGSAQTTNPLVVGGIDPGNLTRRIQTDTSGRINANALSVDQTGTVRNLGSVSNTMQNIAALAVQDLTQFEGQSIAELLAQILVELRISNFYAFNLPALLTTGITNSASDEPASLRNDPSISTVFG